MLSDQMRDLELAVDAAQEAERVLGEVRNATSARVGEAQAVYNAVVAEAKGQVTAAQEAHAAAVVRVNELRDQVRAFLNDILAGGRVRQ